MYFRKLILVSVAIIASAGFAIACNVCSSASCGTGFNMLEKNQRSFLGMKYSTAHSTSKGHHGNFNYDQLNRFDLTGSYVLSNRFQFMANVPYVNNNRSTFDSGLTAKGIGDMSVLGRASVLNCGDSTGVKSFNMWLGAGGKFPTAKKITTTEGAYVPANFTVGTGSVDLLLNALLQGQIGKFGANANFMYSYNGTNNDNYKFGDQMSSTVYFYYDKSCSGNHSFTPFVGVFAEQIEVDENNGVAELTTGGKGLWPLIGANIKTGPVGLGFKYRVPAVQDYAQGHIQNKGYTEISAGWYFGK